jgi:glucoamylase
MASTANAGGMLPEQVWDQNPPSGSPGFPSGRPMFSATPLAWTHAQLIRLAWSIVAGHPVEQPRVVACRYVRKCS